MFSKVQIWKFPIISKNKGRIVLLYKCLCNTLFIIVLEISFGSVALRKQNKGSRIFATFQTPKVSQSSVIFCPNVLSLASRAAFFVGL